MLGIAQNDSFFWDGRQSTLNAAVLEAITNPVEMGLPSSAQIIERLKEDTKYHSLVHADDEQTLRAFRDALVAFLQSLSTLPTTPNGPSTQSDAQVNEAARAGAALFAGKARCHQCHVTTHGRFTDDAFHHTGVGFDIVSGQLTQTLSRLDALQAKYAPLGHIVLSDSEVSQLGRFNVTRSPDDLGAFKTPSLRNVASTSPYMHDGSVRTLEEAIDREIYYRGLNEGSPINLSIDERQRLIAFLQSLNDPN